MTVHACDDGHPVVCLIFIIDNYKSVFLCLLGSGLHGSYTLYLEMKIYQVLFCQLLTQRVERLAQCVGRMMELKKRVMHG